MSTPFCGALAPEKLVRLLSFASFPLLHLQSQFHRQASELTSGITGLLVGERYSIMEEVKALTKYGERMPENLPF